MLYMFVVENDTRTNCQSAVQWF